MEILDATTGYLTNAIKKNFWYIIIALILASGFFLFQNLIIVLVLFLLTSLSKLVESFLPRGVNFDLSLFTIVILQQAYGLLSAFLVVIIAYLVGTLIKGKITNRIAGENLFFPPIGFLLIGLLIPIFNFDLFTIGMIMTIIYASLMTILYGMLYRFPFLNTMIFWVTIIPFNYFIFLNFANPVLQMITI